MLSQIGGVRCSFCGKEGVTAATCPFNPIARESGRARPEKHNSVMLVTKQRALLKKKLRVEQTKIERRASKKCACLTAKNVRCSLNARPGSKYCSRHQNCARDYTLSPQVIKSGKKTQCICTTATGKRCTRTAKPGSKYCAQHAYCRKDYTAVEPSSRIISVPRRKVSPPRRKVSSPRFSPIKRVSPVSPSYDNYMGSPRRRSPVRTSSSMRTSQTRTSSSRSASPEFDINILTSARTGPIRSSRESLGTSRGRSPTRYSPVRDLGSPSYDNYRFSPTRVSPRQSRYSPRRSPRRYSPPRKAPPKRTPPVLVKNLNMPAGGCAVGKIGNRPSMEDAHVVSVLGNDIYLYAVFDGHGGKQISSKLPSVLPKALYQKLVRTNLNNEEEIRQAIINTYLEVDKSFMNVDSGSAAIAVLKIKNKLFFVNLGDSRAVLIEGGRIVHETRDHKPDVPEERRRIEKAGGRVDTQMYPPRVNGILSLSRAFGDRHLKTSSRHSGYAGVDSIISPKPDVTVFTLRSGHKYTLVLACDGLWDVFPSQDVDEYVHKVTTSNACNELVNQAIGRGSGDNVTVMVTEFSV